MLLREAPSTTLADVQEGIESVSGKSVEIANEDFHLELQTTEPTISLGEKITVPANAQGIKAIGDWLDVPSKFLGRIDADLQEHLLNTMLSREGSARANVLYGGSGIDMVRDPNIKFIEPVRIVKIASKVIDPAALVDSFWSTMDEFRLDVMAPEGFDRGIGGDFKVGDITRGGLRIGQDVKHNLAPWTSEFLYRLSCTNGMERFDAGLRIDARGNSVDEVLAEFELMADTAFRRVEDTIASFYELRDQPVDNPERIILRIAEENGISGRVAYELAEAAPSMEGDTMFDVVNLVTNFANEPTMKDGPRRTLQRAGGAVVKDHADRCGHCQSRLGH